MAEAEARTIRISIKLGVALVQVWFTRVKGREVGEKLQEKTIKELVMRVSLRELEFLEEHDVAISYFIDFIFDMESSLHQVSALKY